MNKSEEDEQTHKLQSVRSGHGFPFNMSLAIILAVNIKSVKVSYSDPTQNV